MAKRFTVPWEKIYDYTMECGSKHDPHEFVVAALEEACGIVPYDQGLVFLLDERRRVRGQHLVNIKSRWSTMYLEYYSHLESTNRTLDVEAHEAYGVPLVTQIIWKDEPLTEFTTDYIMARGVKCSLAFVFFDMNGLPRAAFSLDRLHAPRFTEGEMAAMRFAVAQLGNLYKNFFVDAFDATGRKRADVESLAMADLTKREREVVDLLCAGLSPAHVAKTLHISASTAYKHITHIYKKLGVSSQQELLVRALGSKG